VNVRQDEPDDKKADIVSRSEVVLYPGTFNSQECSQYHSFVREVKQETGRVARTDAEQDTEAIESVSEDTVSGIDFFDGIVTDRRFQLLQTSQYIRQLADNQSRAFDVYGAKGDLAERYGYEAYYVANLVSSGYFDEGRFFRQLYFRLEENSSETDRQYRDALDTIVGEKLIAVFVSEDDSVHNVTCDAKSRLLKFHRYDTHSEFFDICGLGEECGQTIDEAVANLCDEYPALDTQQMDRGEERVERLYPESVDDFSIV
jgi:hypothetical protein